MITEKRFQKMTRAQWIFHYMEVMKNRSREKDIRDNLLECIEMAGITAHPKTDREAVVHAMQERHLQKHASSIQQDLMGFFDRAKEAFPETLLVQAIPKPQNDAFVLPKYKKSKSKKGAGLTIENDPANSTPQDGGQDGKS